MTATHVLSVVGVRPGDVHMPLPDVGREHWLSPGRALDIPFDHDPAQVLERARHHFRDQPVDVNVVHWAGRRKKLLIADMDSTIIGCECLDELADMAGLKAKVSAITEKAMRGELDFPAALRERVAMLKGLPLAALERVYVERIRLNPGARTLVATMRKHGAHTLLVSGGFSYFTTRVAKDAGFEADQANILLDDGTALTGEVREPILGGSGGTMPQADTCHRIGPSLRLDPHKLVPHISRNPGGVRTPPGPVSTARGSTGHAHTHLPAHHRVLWRMRRRTLAHDHRHHARRHRSSSVLPPM